MMDRVPGARPLVRFAAALALLIVGCNEKPPPPTQYVDLGEEGRPLLATSGTPMDARIKDGRADWVPFRDPTSTPPETPGGGDPTNTDATANAGAQTPAAVADAAAIERQIRDAIDEYNGLIGDGKWEDSREFFNETDADTVDRLTAAVSALSGKLTELNGALPAPSADLSAAAGALTPASVLRLDVESITISSPTAGVATLKGSGGEPGARFTFGDDGYWYVGVAALTALAPRLAQIDQDVAALDAVIADIKSGNTTGDALAEPIAHAVRLAAQLSAAAVNSPSSGEVDGANDPRGAKPGGSGVGTPDDDGDAPGGG